MKYFQPAMMKLLHGAKGFSASMFFFFFCAKALAKVGRPPQANLAESVQLQLNVQGTGRHAAGFAGGSSWYSQPWIWAIVTALLILVIAFIDGNASRRPANQDNENRLP